MKTETKKEVKKLIELNELSKKDFDSPVIEEIADRFPGEYKNEQEYIEFQEEIASIL